MALLVVTSCSNVDSKLENQIPADAVMVAKLDVLNFIEHSGIDIKDGKIVLPQKFMDMLRDMGTDLSNFDAEGAKFVESGVDFKNSIYCFVPADAKGDALVALVPVSDAKKLQAYIEDQAGAKMEDKGGILALKVGGGNGLAIFDDVLYCLSGLGSTSPEDRVKQLSSLEKSIAGNAAAVKAIDASEDLNIYLNNSFLQKIAAGQGARMGGMAAQAQPVLELLKDIKSTAYHVSLADGGLKFKHENDIEANCDLAKLASQVVAKPSADLLPLLPKAKNVAVFSLALNGEGIANLEMVKTYTNQLSGSPEKEKAFEIIKSINGPITLAVASDELTGQNFCGALAFKCGKAGELLGIVENSLDQLVTRKGDELVLNQPINGRDGAIGVKNGAVYIKFGDKSFAENLASVGAAKDIVGKSVCGAYFSVTQGAVEVEFAAEAADIKGSSAKVTIKENGKKLSSLEAIGALYGAFKHLKN